MGNKKNELLKMLDQEEGNLEITKGSPISLSTTKNQEKREDTSTRQNAKGKRYLNGYVYVKQGMWFREDLLRKYDGIIFAQKLKGTKMERYKLINEDMEKGLQQRKSNVKELKDAGQEELEI